MDKLTRRRFLLDLACVGGVIALAAGHGLQARPVPARELKKKMDNAIDKAFQKPDPPPAPPPPPPPPPQRRHGGAVAPPVYPRGGDVASPPPRR